MRVDTPLNTPENQEGAAHVKRLLRAVQTLQHQLATIEAKKHEPIAIVSMAVRFPGADSPAALWELLQTGQDAIREVPPDRWDIDAYYDPNPDALDRMITRSGGFLDQVDRFDAAFFKLSPREASLLDPQQRLLLELTWEALEHANLSPLHLPALTGIFVGLSTNDYANLLAATREGQQSRTYQITGNASSTASGRLAHFLNVQGPVYTVDTACSSSLVAVHLAVQSLRTGECDLALAGGANCILDPEGTIGLSQGQFLAPDGHCKTFDASADGFVRSEGGGMVLLKRLSDARRDGDTILAVIRGSAVNHDGQTSGLTVPSGPSQQAVVRAALANARLQPGDIGYVEAHGTGTPLGDPIEVNALGMVFAERDEPLYLGSIKTNMGHLEAAAGIAGLCKVVVALQHSTIPPHLHLQTPNPHVDWDALPVQVTTTGTPWPMGKAAGVSSFGISGTNAHVILEAAPLPASALHALPPNPRPAFLLPLSAKSDAALHALAQRYAEYLAAHPGLALADVAHTAATRRSHFPHRLALVAPDTASAQQQFAAFASGEATGTLAGIASRTSSPQVAFLFTGQGSQYAGMGRQLYETQPIYRAALDECAALLQPHLDMPLLDVLVSDDERLQQTMYTQPALFALEYALARLWQAWGVQPALLLGHSIGEYVAACLAGVFSLADALKLVAARGRLMQALPQTGQMVAIQADPQAVQAAVEPYAAQASLAAVNSPRSVVIAGETEAVQALAAQFEAEGRKTRVLQTSHAFHSPLMEPMLNEFAAVAQEITYHPPRLPVVSDVSGQVAGDEFTTPAYWVQHARQPVQFAAGMTALAEAGATVYLEVGPHPTLMVMGQQCLSDEQAGSAAWAASLHREREDWPHLLGALARLYVAGVPLDWEAVYLPAQHQRVPLPTYPFQRQRYWLAPYPNHNQQQIHTVRDGARLESSNGDAPFWQEELQPAPQPAVPTSAVRQQLAQATPDERRTLLARQVQQQISGVLGWAEAVPLDERFFELGMDSLMALELRNALQKSLGCSLPNTLLFDYPTGNKLVAYLEQHLFDAAAPGGTPAALPAIPPVDTALPIFPLSYGQQALWFMHQQASQSAAYHHAMIMQLPERVDQAGLRRALNALAARHPALRSSFTLVKGRLVQVVQEATSVPLEVVDGTGWSVDEPRQPLAALFRRPFDLAESVFRATLITGKSGQHRLLLMVHHIISDARTQTVLARDLNELYRAEMTGTPAQLPLLEHSYADYVRWEAALLREEGQRLQRYWREQLAGELPILQLPTDYPRPSVQTFNGAAHSETLNLQLTREIKALAQAQGVTLFMLLLAAYQVLLYRLTGQDDLLVGTAPEAGRTRPEFVEMVGYFVNALVLRATIDRDAPPSFAAFLAQASQTVRGALAHQLYPSSLLAQELLPHHDASTSPLFQTQFLLYQRPLFTGADNLLTPAFLDEDDRGGLGQFDLSLFITDQGETLRVVFDYNADLFTAETIARWAGHFVCLLQSMVTNPEQPIDRLPLLTRSELERILNDWNDTAAAYPHDACLHHLFEQQAARTPEATAVVFADQALSYGELNQRSNQLAHHLIGLGVGPEVLVALCLDRSLELAIGLLGILKAGGAYVPLDPNYPIERLAFMLEESQAPVLLTQEHVRETLPPHTAQVLCLDSDWLPIAQQPATNPASDVHPENLAYVIYTSGSTGKPKGAQVEHRSIVNLTWAFARQWGLHPQDRVLQFAALSFDAAVEELFLAWLSGAALVFRPQDILASFARFTAFVTEQSITLLDLPTAFWHTWAAVLQQDPRPLPPSVRLVSVGGEAARHSTYQTWMEQLAPDIRWINAYGPTEATVASTSYEPATPAEAFSPTGVVPIGFPVPNAQVYILDTHLQPVPIGVAGELYIGGVGVSRGYRNQPALTAERFLPNPFAAGRIYKTGDLARYRPDGSIEFLGRADFQVKVRGFRVELGEIETMLNQHPAVQQAVVIARTGASGTQLVAYVVSDTAEPTALRAYLGERLPDYMIPAAFVLLDALPLNPNGKVDRKALPAPDAASLVRADYMAPRTPMEQTLATIWQRVLDVEQVGMHDNFFTLGGHSLLAVQLVNAMEQATGQSLPLAALLRHPTIATLAVLLDTGTEAAPSVRSLVAVQPAGSRPPLFLVHPVGGHVLCYAPLTRWLGNEQPVYGLQAVGVQGDESPLTSIAAMAAHYIAEMRTVQPSGPYHLGGWSLGGAVALEMAQQLQQQGQDVALLVLFDGFLPQPETLPVAHNHALVSHFLADLQGQQDANTAHIPDFGNLEHLDPDTHAAELLAQPAVAAAVPAGITPEQMRVWWRVFRANTEALAAYQPAAYSGRVVLWYATEQSWSVLESWQAIAPHLESIPVPGNHYTLLQAPLVQHIAEQVMCKTGTGHAVTAQ